MVRNLRWILAAALLALAACVTINVYFPAAEAEKAAREFVDDVIGRPAGGDVDSGAGDDTRGNRGASAPSIRFFEVFPSAYAQADINIRTPAIQAIRERMRSRFETLRPHFASGAIGMTRDGRIAVRDPSALPLKDRATLNAAVAEDNRDRDAVYREIAVANGHPEWENDIRATFAREWIQAAGAGWYYQDAGGSWVQK
jgi:uncharacterized protein YdbL (DUF1318 family)